MTVEKQRPRRARHLQRAIDERVARRFEDLGGEPAAPEQRAQVLRIAPDVRAVRGNIGNREWLEQLADDLLLMRVAPTRSSRSCGTVDSGRCASNDVPDDKSRAQLTLLRIQSTPPRTE